MALGSGMGAEGARFGATLLTLGGATPSELGGGIVCCVLSVGGSVLGICAPGMAWLSE